MGKDFRQSIIVGSVLFGSIVGAGFASGKEVWFYFAQFGWVCFPLILGTGVLFCILSYYFLEFGKKFSIKNVQQMNSKLFGKMSNIVDLLFIFGNIIILSGMFAGANSLFDIVLPSSLYRYASVITAIIAVVVAWLGFNKMMKVNLLVVPAMVVITVGIFLCCIFNYTQITIPLVQNISTVFTALFFSVLFVCSNMFFAGFIFAKLGEEHSTKQNFLGSVLGAVFMVLCLMGMVLSIYLNPYSSMTDMPLVYIANNTSEIFGICALIVVWFGILTTAISLIYTIANWLNDYIGHYKLCTIVVTIGCLIVSGLGFGTIVNYLYPALGVFGVGYIIMLIKIKNKSPQLCTKD